MKRATAGNVAIDPKPILLSHLPVLPRALRMVMVIGICLVEVVMIVFKLGLSIARRTVEESGTCLVEVALIVFKIKLSRAYRMA